MSRVGMIVLGASLMLLSTGCPPPEEMKPYTPPDLSKDYSRALRPGEIALRKIPLEQYPDFRPGFYERAGLEVAIRHSLDYMRKPSSQNYYPYGTSREITHARVVARLEAFLRVLNEAQSAAHLNEIIRRRFDVYESIGWDDQGTVLFTGYYTPIFDGRRQRDAQFRYPLYGLPPDLVKDSEGRTLGRRNPSGGLDPRYPTRREIEQNRLLEGHEVAWVKDPFEAYIITVQGSAKLRLADGSMFELGYAGNNGHEYTPIRDKLVEDGVMKPEQVSLQRMLAFFKQNPDKVYEYTWTNDRFVFFGERPGGPFGSLNTPVTPLRSIATDKSVFPRAALAFLQTTLPREYDGRVAQLPFGGFALDQDTGGAIRAAGRCDVYMGVGNRAEALAGRTYSEGQLYYLFLREGLASGGPGEPAAAERRN